MAHCEMCGKEAELFVAIIEGTELKVCKDDSKFGRVLRAVHNAPVNKKAEKQNALLVETVILFNPDFPMLIKQKRESRGLTQEEFGKELNEKASTIHQLESGHMKPSVELARKIERILKIKIVEEYQEKHVSQGKPKSDVVTLGDLIKIKMNK